MAKTIIIVNDSADTRLVVSARLKKHQDDTVFAADVLQAVSVALKKRPDLVSALQNRTRGCYVLEATCARRRPMWPIITPHAMSAGKDA